MTHCNARPYEGEEKYIFVSYCHKDSEKVFPVVERLAKEGYRVWYDEGINPGTEWPEIIAQHLNNCTVCMAFISQSSLESHNCRREINFALLKKKPLISVVLEEVSLSLGMEMQLSTNQAIFKYTIESRKEFMEKLCESESLPECKGKPDPDIAVSDEAECILTREKTGKSIVIPEGTLRMGRSNIQSDYVIPDNAAVGRLHAMLVRRENNCYLIDNSSKNKTYINGKQLTPEKEYLLADGDIIKLGNEVLNFTCR